MMSKPISVSRLTQSIKNTLESGFSDIAVEGEISNFKEHSSGHRYFTLKDSNAQIACTMWKARSLNFMPKDGMKVVLTGSVSVYPPRGNYQIDVTSMLPAGKGDLYLAYEALKLKLEELGYFSADNKKMLPRIPLSIGISTSPTGAAIQDMLTTIERRFPACNVYFRPTLVQGEGSAEDIVAAINELLKTPAEVIIIGRGGGSIEDLWAYNMEIVADAIFKSPVPIISAVGHETDFTIADFVADRRAATPTAAAEIVTPYILDELSSDINANLTYLTKTMKGFITRKKDELGSSFGKHLRKMISDKLKQHHQTIDTSELLMRNRLQQKLVLHKSKLETLNKLMTSYHPLEPLNRGFAALRSNGQLLKPSESLAGLKKVEILRKNESALVKIEKILPPDIFMVSHNE